MNIENYRGPSTSRHGTDNCALKRRAGWLGDCQCAHRETREHRGKTPAGQFQAKHGSIVMATINWQ
jgi:hypothetical protein